VKKIQIRLASNLLTQRAPKPPLPHDINIWVNCVLIVSSPQPLPRKTQEKRINLSEEPSL